MKNDPAPMNGQELFNVLYGSQFRFDKEKVPEEIHALREKIMKEYGEGEKQPKKKFELVQQIKKLKEELI